MPTWRQTANEVCGIWYGGWPGWACHEREAL